MQHWWLHASEHFDFSFYKPTTHSHPSLNIRGCWKKKINKSRFQDTCNRRQPVNEEILRSLPRDAGSLYFFLAIQKKCSSFSSRRRRGYTVLIPIRIPRLYTQARHVCISYKKQPLAACVAVCDVDDFLTLEYKTQRARGEIPSECTAVDR